MKIFTMVTITFSAFVCLLCSGVGIWNIINNNMMWGIIDLIFGITNGILCIINYNNYKQING